MTATSQYLNLPLRSEAEARADIVELKLRISSHYQLNDNEEDREVELAGNGRGLK